MQISYWLLLTKAVRCSIGFFFTSCTNSSLAFTACVSSAAFKMKENSRMRSLPRTLQQFADLNHAIEIQPIRIQESICTFDGIRPKVPIEHRTCMSRRLCWPQCCLWRHGFLKNFYPVTKYHPEVQHRFCCAYLLDKARFAKACVTPPRNEKSERERVRVLLNAYRLTSCYIIN